MQTTVVVVPGQPEAAGWRVLTGTHADVDRLAEAVGFRYAYDPARDQFAHPSGLLVLTPRGKISRCFYNLDYRPGDVNLALLEASEGKIGTVADSLLLYCYHYDPMTGRYGLVVMRAMRIAGTVTVLMLGGFIVVMVTRERRRGSSLTAR